MRLKFLTLLLLAACAKTTLGPTAPSDRITLSESGSTNGGYSLIITPDDRLVYDAYGSGAAPSLPGWQWSDPQRISGQASTQSPGAFRRAIRLLEGSPDAPNCAPAPRANRGSIRLTRDAQTLYESLTPQPDCTVNGQNARQGYETLNAALRAAILPNDWSPIAP